MPEKIEKYSIYLKIQNVTNMGSTSKVLVTNTEFDILGNSS